MNAISLNPVNKMSKDEEKIKCQGNVPSRYLKEATSSCHNLCKYGRKHVSEHDEKHLTSRRFMARSTTINSDTTKFMEQKIRSERVGTSNNLVGANMLNPLSKHRRAASSPHFIIPGHARRYSGSLAKKTGVFDNFNNNVSEAHSLTHGSIEIIPRNLEQKIQAQVDDDVTAQIQTKKIVESKNNINVDIGALSLECKRNERKSKVLSKSKSTPIKRNILKQNSSASTKADSGGNINIFEKVLSNQKESATFSTLKQLKQKDMAFRKASSEPQSNNQSASLLSRKTNSSATLLMPLNVKNSQLNTSRSMNGRMNRGENLHINETCEVEETKLLKPERTSIFSTKPSNGTVSLKAWKSRYAQQAMPKKSGKARDDRCDFKDKAFKKSGKIAKRSFRRKRDIGGSNEHNSEVQSAILKKTNLAPKVGLLEYQDALGKEFRALFNEVIEETTNKLVQTRKSNVEALVGAFETVISLQESKLTSV